MNIIKKTSTVHTVYKANRSLSFIVLHYTAGTSSKKGAARGVASMFANPNNRPASADFIVDDDEIIQYNPDVRNRYCASVGGDKWKTKYTKEAGIYYGTCRNNNSISIEMCSNKTNKSSLLATDRDWYLTEATVANAIELTKSLMKTYSIPKERVIMHHHVTGKLCPQPWCIDNAALAKWQAIKTKLSGASVNVDYKVMVTDSTGLNCRSDAGSNFVIITTYPKGTVLHITKENGGWGYTGEGWVNLSYTQKYTEEDDMTQADWDKIQRMINTSIKSALEGKGLPASEWAISEGVITTAISEGVSDGSRPQGYAKREEVLAMILRALKKK